ncbi:MAG: hypothetical protein P4L85_27720 [Paludisphaera borealis]|uniref:hypothetical protein n=1 Tax=Paludisphaera borealis TaxID=1387353 RepID=UPI00283C648D|nr:hypothetical protein [Paludisphaera borealis]MDR3623173.1 hypothetical protein [Paludisphaera borealis]
MTRTAGLRRSFPTFWLMTAPFRWFLRSKWRVFGAVVAVLAMAAAPPLWWATQLVGLPDVGDPFDVEAFQTETIPDDQNAFVLYRRAEGLFKLRKSSPDTSTKVLLDPLSRWSTTVPENRRWAEVNRDVLALYRRGADRPDALDSSLMTSGGGPELDAFRAFQLLAFLEASRLEEQGDMAGAWGWYRANLRMVHHVGSRGTLLRRSYAQSWHVSLRKRAAAWAADARTTPAQLRQALDDVLACEAIAPSESYTLKAEYLNVIKDQSAWRRRGFSKPPWWEKAFPILASHLIPEQRAAIADAWSLWRRDSERCRRLVGLVAANRLAFYDLPPDRRPSPDPGVSSCDLYAFGPEAPAKARALAPEAIGRWLDSTDRSLGAIDFLNWWGQRIKEVANHRELVLLLATQLYRRDHGADPPKPEALVGPYLKSLPPAYPDEGKDESLPLDAPVID